MASAIGGAVLDILLGEYIVQAAGSQRQLELDLLNGHLLLQNLTVRSQALQRLGLPVVVRAGIIGRVEMRIPWSRLSTEPTRLVLDNLLLLVGPQSESEWDHAAEEKRSFERKQAALASLDRSSAAASEVTRDKGSSFAQRLASKVTDRLQVCMCLRACACACATALLCVAIAADPHPDRGRLSSRTLRYATSMRRMVRASTRSRFTSARSRCSHRRSKTPRRGSWRWHARRAGRTMSALAVTAGGGRLAASPSFGTRQRGWRRRR